MNNYKDDFEMLNKSLIYFDNGATTFKPKSVVNAIVDYYTNYTANAHRGDYDISFIVDTKYENTREKVRQFINADKSSEIVFTSGATQSLNMIVTGFFANYLQDGDEVLLTKAEHASNILPWFNIKKDINIKYIELDNEQVTLENVKKSITKNTKVISIAQVTNVIGDRRPIKEICKLAHENNILVVVDAAQSIPHTKVDVKDLDCDFLAFSAHKMCGPTGIGILYGKFDLLKIMDPLMSGGGDNARFDMCGNVAFLAPPAKFEAGTLNLEGIYGLGACIDYINSIGLDNISSYEKELRKYAINKLKSLDNIIIYNETADAGIITINVKGVFPQDEASYLNSKGICVRSGEHCAKLLKDLLKTVGTIRISFYFYNTFDEIDTLYEALKNGGDFLDAYFN